MSVRGVSAGQIVRDQPGVKEQVGVYLDESGDLAVAVHARHRPVRPQPRRDPARPAGHPVRLGSVGGTIRYITNQPKLGVTRALVEANVNTVDDGDIGDHLKGAINVPLGDTAAVRAVAYDTQYAGFIDAVGPGGGKNVNDGSRIGGRDRRCSGSRRPNSRSRRGSSTRRSQPTASTARRSYNLFANQFTTTAADRFGKREQYLLLARSSRTRPSRRPDASSTSALSS